MDTSSMNNHTTDARPNNQIENARHSRQAIINVEILKQIESELEEFEQISILFLLAAELPNSYSKVLELCRSVNSRPHIVTEYIQNNVEIWCDKLIEAMCVIGNYEILQNLGFPESLQLDNIYCPNISRFAVSLNQATKVLYKLFESLNIEKTQLLLQRVYGEGQIVKQLDSHYLELHALYWIQEGFITITSDGQANLENLHKHLKQLDLYTESIYHDVGHFCYKPPKSIDSKNQGKPVSNKLLEITSQIRGPPALPDGKENEKMIKKGSCVIINEVDFRLPYKRRDGSDADVENLSKTFHRRNFDVLQKNNLTRVGIIELLENLPETFDEKKYDCLIVCILSHGYKGGIITCDGMEIPIKVIDDKVCTMKLRNVIKILIVQACQGTSIGDVSLKTELTTDGPRELIALSDARESDLATDAPTENILRFKNYFQFMSTMDDFVSIRHKKLGSWFIEAVCEELSRESMISLFVWSADVIANVEKKSGQVGEVEMASQIPSCTTRLGMTVYFPPFVDN